MSAKLIVLGSSSRGNGYLLDCGDESLIIECGMPFKALAETTQYDISKVKAAICTHKHKDHAAYIKQYQQHGIRVYSNEEVSAMFANVAPMQAGRKYHVGKFVIIGLDVPHGDCQCFCYIVEHCSLGRLLFATDLENFPYIITKCNHICIEANYSEDIRVDAILNGIEQRAQSQNHMELNEVIAVIKRHKTSGLQSVVLLHLSDGLSDADGFKTRIFDECGIHAEVAEKNTTLILSKEDF